MSSSLTAALRELALRLGAEQQVAPASMPPEGWSFDDEGSLRHERTDFFDVVGVHGADGRSHVVMRQPETAIVGLVVTRVGGVRSALLTARCEPGLHGGCQFSTTVQSTPSNYLRRHGGAATPHLDIVLDPPGASSVLHDSHQYDWGQFYLGKTKRFVIVEVDDPPEADLPAVWVAESDYLDLLQTDFGVTSDLRAALAILLAHDLGIAPDSVSAATIDISRVREAHRDDLALCDLRLVPGWDGAASTSGPVVRAVHVFSRSREVKTWQQPLLEIAEPSEARLFAREDVDGALGHRRYGIQARTALGLQGVQLWYPAGGFERQAAAHTPVAVRTSAEGGRFLRHEVTVETVVLEAADGESATPPSASEQVQGLVEWVTLPELVALCLRDECASIELRLALSSVLATTASKGLEA